jgi:hypothetical protein
MHPFLLRSILKKYLIRYSSIRYNLPVTNNMITTIKTIPNPPLG